MFPIGLEVRISIGTLEGCEIAADANVLRYRKVYWIYKFRFLFLVFFRFVTKIRPIGSQFFLKNFPFYPGRTPVALP